MPGVLPKTWPRFAHYFPAPLLAAGSRKRQPPKGLLVDWI
jgi:hypothetical protein